MRWLGGGGEFSRCLNQKYPEKNNFLDSWGVSYGPTWYKCGDINVHGYLSNPQELKVKPSNPKLNPVSFKMCGADPNCRSQETNGNKDWCKKKGESVTCFKERTYHNAWTAENVPKKIETKFLDRDVSECAIVKF